MAFFRKHRREPNNVGRPVSFWKRKGTKPKSNNSPIKTSPTKASRSGKVDAHPKAPKTPAHVSKIQPQRSHRFVSPDSFMIALNDVEQELPENSSPSSQNVIRTLYLNEDISPSPLQSPVEASVERIGRQESDVFEDAQQHPTCATPRDDNAGPPTLIRRVSFADEWGSPLQQIQVLDLPSTKRVVLLLLSPKDRTFEFLHAEYPLDIHTTVQVVLEQIPFLAANPVFQTKQFASLAKTKTKHELPTDQSLGDCQLEESELLLGVLQGHSLPEIITFAVPLLLNGNILKAVNHAKQTGKGLKTVLAGEHWRRQQRPRSCPRKRKPPTVTILPSPSKHPEELVADNTSLESNGELLTANTDDTGTLDTLKDSKDQNIQLIEGSCQKGTYHTETMSAQLVSSLSETRNSPEKERAIADAVNLRLRRDNSEANAKSVVEALMTTENRDFGPSSLSSDEEKGEAPDNDSSTAASSGSSTTAEQGHVVDEIPDMDKTLVAADHGATSAWDYPELVRDCLGGDEGTEGTEKAVFWIHAMTIAAVGYISAMSLA